MITDKELVEALHQKLSEYETALSKAESQVADLRPRVASLRTTIGTFEADERGPTPQESLFGNDDLPELSLKEIVSNGHQVSNPFTKGNRSPKMPERRSEFANMSVIEAEGGILERASGSMHANEVTTELYVIHTREEFKAAKHTAASELRRGAQKGHWRKLGGNRYVKNQEE